MATLYLNEDLHPDAFAVGARLPVWGAEARHAAQVARVRTGERIGIGDGRGRVAWGPVVHVAATEVAIQAEEIVIDAPRAPRLRLVQALAKGDRDELAIQAATELGVDEIVPWQAARSVSRWEGPKLAKGLERWRAVVREAAKQAIRGTVPTVLEPVGSRALIEELARSQAGPIGAPGDRAAGAVALVLEPSAEEPLTGMVGRLFAAGAAADPVERITLIVGPEGGISDEELVQFDAAGAIPVRLGAEVLRTSTAGPAAIAALCALLGRW